MKAQDGIDIGFMHAALRLAEGGWGRVHPNPLVGAVVVRDGAVVGKGHHRDYGGPHAEVEALAAAGEAARGATLYVTLEPCAHFGKTPPCTDAIITAGIQRVVFAARDPHPQARGGAAVLAEAGIDVKGEVASEFARTQNAPFFKLHEQDDPFVALKLAMSLDARLTSSKNVRERITGEAADREVHRLRCGFDAIMIGANTVQIDDPVLTVRHGYLPVRPPVRVTLDTHGRLANDSALLRTAGEAPLWVVTGETAEVARLERAGARVIVVATIDGLIDLRAAIKRLHAEGIRSVFCEGGAAVAGALLEAGLVDRIYTFVAPRLLGAGGTPAFALHNPLNQPQWRLQRIAQHGEDALLMLDRCSQD